MRPMSLGWGVMLIVGLAGGPTYCAAGPPPDSLAAVEMRHAIGQRRWVRVETFSSAARIIRPRVSPAGLEFSECRPDKPGSDVGTLPNPIPLARVYKIEVPVNASGRGLLFGVLLGAAVGALTGKALADWQPLGASREPAGSHTGDIVRGAALGVVPGALLGVLIGSAFHDMKQVYPPEPRPGGQVR